MQLESVRNDYSSIVEQFMFLSVMWLFLLITNIKF